MENQCEVLNRSSCRGSVNYIIFSRRHSAQTCQVPASGGCLSSCWGKSLSPGSSVNCKRTSYPRKAACSGQLSEANPQQHPAFRCHRDRRCQELERGCQGLREKVSQCAQCEPKEKAGPSYLGGPAVWWAKGERKKRSEAMKGKQARRNKKRRAGLCKESTGATMNFRTKALTTLLLFGQGD